MADQPINGLPKKTAAADTDALLMIGASEEYQIDYGKLADAILNKLTNKTFALDQGSKSLVAALNELNSKTVQNFSIFIDWQTPISSNEDFVNKIIDKLHENFKKGVSKLFHVNYGKAGFICTGMVTYVRDNYFTFYIFIRDKQEILFCEYYGDQITVTTHKLT